MNINFRLVLNLLGYLVGYTGILMLIPAIIDFFMKEEAWKTFFIFSLLITFIGFAFAFANKQEQTQGLSNKDGLLLTILAWLVIVALTALPFTYSYLEMSYTDSYFEMMSGITTTGATVIPALDKLSYGFHFWRAFIQWVGGIGIIVTAVILIPSMQGGGMQLFKIEAFETFDSAKEKVKKIAMGMIIIYLCITFLSLVALMFIAELGFFDALIHSLTSVSTAGFSNKDSSVGYFQNPKMELILTFSMISGGMPYMLLYYFVFLRKTLIFQDSQIKAYLFLLLSITTIISIWLISHNGLPAGDSVRQTMFTVASLLTGTGFVLVDYSLWGTFPTMVLLITMFIGGCGGSTACGIKIYRIQVAFIIAKNTIEKLFLKQHMSIPFYNKRVISPDFATGVFVYLFLLMVTLFISSAILSSLDLDFITAFTATVACITNVGPGLGNIVGPAGNFSSLPDMAKWVLSLTMLLGRLEILGVLIICSRKFWTN